MYITDPKRFAIDYTDENSLTFEHVKALLFDCVFKKNIIVIYENESNLLVKTLITSHERFKLDIISAESISFDFKDELLDNLNIKQTDVFFVIKTSDAVFALCDHQISLDDSDSYYEKPELISQETT